MCSGVILPHGLIYTAVKLALETYEHEVDSSTCTVIMTLSKSREDGLHTPGGPGPGRQEYAAILPRAY